ncbi:Gfo/Idh/MocA family protein [Lederbergia lenta]|uniref:Gfo/Idh/MocA family protein n=1 Tax=Lederbergia lenta TaxID=1467 RepID=UPI0032E80390
MNYKLHLSEGKVGEHMIRVLLIGLGTMGRTHLSCYAKMENVKMMGVIDTNKIIRNDMSEKYQVEGFETLEEAMEVIGNVDVIDVALPTYLHEEYVKKAANYVKNIICEKPITLSIDAAKEMIEYCDRNGVNLYLGHVVRFFNEYKKLKEAVEKGAIGKVGVVRTFRGGPFPKTPLGWYNEQKKSGGVILDLIIHDFDFLRWTFGEVERVFAKGVKDMTGLGYDYALVTLRFKSGVIAHVEGSWAHESFKMSMEISGEDGILEFDSSKNKSIHSFVRADDLNEGVKGVAVPESPLKNSPYFVELEHFIDCIQNKKEPIITPFDALKAVEISLAARKSIRTGQPVFIN